LDAPVEIAYSDLHMIDSFKHKTPFEPDLVLP
jgi:hypothetical protein